MSILLGRQAVAWQSLKVSYFFCDDLFFFGFLQNCFGQRMFTFLFQANGQTKQLIFTDANRWYQFGDCWLAAGDGAGFIQCHNLNLTGFFERCGCFEQNSMFCSNAIADHNGNRRCQTQRTGAADH